MHSSGVELGKFVNTLDGISSFGSGGKGYTLNPPYRYKNILYVIKYIKFIIDFFTLGKRK